MFDTDKIKSAIPAMREALAEAKAEGYIGVISIADVVGREMGLTADEADIVRALAS